MNWGVLWYIDFADWSVISPCTKAIQTCVKFVVGTCSFTLYVLVQFYGKSEFCENAGFHSAGHKYWQMLVLHCIHSVYLAKYLAESKTAKSFYCQKKLHCTARLWGSNQVSTHAP